MSRARSGTPSRVSMRTPSSKTQPSIYAVSARSANGDGTRDLRSVSSSISHLLQQERVRHQRAAEERGTSPPRERATTAPGTHIFLGRSTGMDAGAETRDAARTPSAAALIAASEYRSAYRARVAQAELTAAEERLIALRDQIRGGDETSFGDAYEVAASASVGTGRPPVAQLDFISTTGVQTAPMTSESATQTPDRHRDARAQSAKHDASSHPHAHTAGAIVTAIPMFSPPPPVLATPYGPYQPLVVTPPAQPTRVSAHEPSPIAQLRREYLQHHDVTAAGIRDTNWRAPPSDAMSDPGTELSEKDAASSHFSSSVMPRVIQQQSTPQPIMPSQNMSAISVPADPFVANKTPGFDALFGKSAGFDPIEKVVGTSHRSNNTVSSTLRSPMSPVVRIHTPLNIRNVVASPLLPQFSPLSATPPRHDSFVEHALGLASSARRNPGRVPV